MNKLLGELPIMSNSLGSYLGVQYNLIQGHFHTNYAGAVESNQHPVYSPLYHLCISTLQQALGAITLSSLTA